MQAYHAIHGIQFIRLKQHLIIILFDPSRCTTSSCLCIPCKQTLDTRVANAHIEAPVALQHDRALCNALCSEAGTTVSDYATTGSHPDGHRCCGSRQHWCWA